MVVPATSKSNMTGQVYYLTSFDTFPSLYHPKLPKNQDLPDDPSTMPTLTTIYKVNLHVVKKRKRRR